MFRRLTSNSKTAFDMFDQPLHFSGRNRVACIRGIDCSENPQYGAKKDIRSYQGVFLVPKSSLKFNAF